MWKLLGLGSLSSIGSHCHGLALAVTDWFSLSWRTVRKKRERKTEQTSFDKAIAYLPPLISGAYSANGRVVGRRVGSEKIDH